MLGKLVDFDIMVAAKPGQISEQMSSLEESVFRLLMNVKRQQKQ